MKPDWKPAVEYGRCGWAAVIQRKRWFGTQRRYAFWWTYKQEWTFDSIGPLAQASRTEAEKVARDAADYKNDQEARARREIFEVE